MGAPMLGVCSSDTLCGLPSLRPDAERCDRGVDMSDAFQRRAELALERAHDEYVLLGRMDLLLVREDHPVTPISADVVPKLLRGLGLGGLLAQIARGRAVRSADMAPVLVIVDSYATLTWIEAPVARAAGAA